MSPDYSKEELEGFIALMDRASVRLKKVMIEFNLYIMQGHATNALSGSIFEYISQVEMNYDDYQFWFRRSEALLAESAGHTALAQIKQTEMENLSNEMQENGKKFGIEVTPGNDSWTELFERFD